MHAPSVGDVVWEPGPDALETTRIGEYMAWLRDLRGRRFATYDELWQWSVDDPDGFWRSLWDYFAVHSAIEPTAVLESSDMPGATWFPGVRVNYAAELFARSEAWLDQPAIVGVSQTRPTVEWTFADLRAQIARVRAGLVRLGVQAGDRVVAYMPNIPETVAACYACASLGAIWASAAPEFGAQAVIDRFGQLEPAVLLVVDGYRYGDKDIDLRDRVAAIRAAIPSLRHVVAMPYNGRDVAGAVEWDQLVAHEEPLDALDVAFDHPLWVLFSSGTTGLPKAIVHGHGGMILEAFKANALGFDLRAGDRLMWFSTTAWMMWNVLVSTLLCGASIVTIDGNPLFPDLREQWRIAERTRPTVLGLGPVLVVNSAKAGLEPTRELDLTSIRSLAASGSPMPVDGFVWLTEQFGGRVPLNVCSGGTDLCGGIVQGYPIVPVYAGEMSTKALGVAAYAYDEAGDPVVGELGELVITQPIPSMPVCFWGDDDQMSRYRSTYYEQYPGVMRFGDWVRFSERGSSVIAGRSDATLNRGGVRLGTAEIYRVVERHPDVADSLVVHLDDPGGGPGELILFVVTAGRELDDELRRELVDELRRALSPRHAPDTVVAMSAVPRNLTGKKLELPVKRILQGAHPSTVVSRDAMLDPAALDSYVELARDRNR